MGIFCVRPCSRFFNKAFHDGVKMGYLGFDALLKNYISVKAFVMLIIGRFPLRTEYRQTPCVVGC
jgi:hypothetical protein